MRRIGFLLLSALISFQIVNAQERNNINIGVSTPGVIPLSDWNHSSFNVPNLQSVDFNSRDMVLMPAYSVELSHMLDDEGFFKRLSLVGNAGFGMFQFDKRDLASHAVTSSETVSYFILLAGIRYRYFDARRLHGYGQFMMGGYIRDNSDYWKRYDSDVAVGPEGEHIAIQLTFLGLQWDLLKDHRLSVVGELGYGTEYALTTLFPLIPGLRLGIGYNF